MVSVHDKWIRIFDVPDVRKHKNGFTIYKVVSMLYPENCPDAVTRVIVWKRFNDFRKLHKDLKSLYKKLTKSKDFPSLPAKTVLKRFDDDTIHERKQSVLNFLEFVGGNYQLFTSKEFVKFLETSHTPAELLSSNINNIRAELQLPEDPEVSTTLSDDDVTISDTDSISTMCSLASPVQVDMFSESAKNTLPHPKLKKFNSSTSINSHTSSNISDLSSVTNIFDNISIVDGQGFNIPYIKSLDDNIQYILDASVHINLAAELEEDRSFAEAHVAYNTAIDILMKHGSDDPNYDRRQLVKYKMDKYKIRAEKIYNMYLAPEIKNLQLLNRPVEEDPFKKPLFDLYKFKAVKIIDGKGILVLHSELQKLFYIKVIHKTMQFLNENLILPENVPYMVKLDSHYNCENALFLVLEYCSGMKLSDYLKRQVDDTTFNKTTEVLTSQFHEESDNESEGSFSELVSEYHNSRILNRSSSQNMFKDEINADKDDISSDGSFEKLDLEDNARDKIISDQIWRDAEPQSSSDATLNEQIFHQKYTRRKETDLDTSIISRKQSTTSSQRSQVSSFDTDCFRDRVVVSEKVVIKWAAQLLLALDKLHTLGIICRDLELKNLLINDTGDLSLTYMCNNKELGDLFSVNINYNLAPEVYSFTPVTNSADWFSYGTILYELLVGIPFSEIHLSGLTSNTFLKIPRYVSPEGRSILKQLLTYQSEDRLGSGINGTENIKSHPFFKSISWSSLNYSV
ncbi:ribosomal protein S6 kinase delta-1 [Diabrotica virgifera virgifera]|uniref:Ribosomal protein S6 kinase delta-1 isoform X1 n=1 Tax=Diabrotica virgifera virgifera TaxID=50390 RepID=A0A6P7FXU8_DIAVI|nr:ribosomal protein S6 kinase delta-1 [Diabrotica virgifera virgifera]